jgi:copper chaperone CopZ
MISKTFSITGMHCKSCALNIDLNLKELDGVESVSTDLESGITKVLYEESKLSEQKIIEKITDIGYEANLI